MLEYEGLCSAIASCTGVIHLASPTPFEHIPIPNPEVEFVESAIKGTRNVQNACLKAKVKKVVVVSSVAAVMVNPNCPRINPWMKIVGATLNSANNWRFSLCCSPALLFFFHTLTPETAALQILNQKVIESKKGLEGIKKDDILTELKKQLSLAGPIVAMNLLLYCLHVISVMFVGHLGELPLSGLPLPPPLPLSLASASCALCIAIEYVVDGVEVGLLRLQTLPEAVMLKLCLKSEIMLLKCSRHEYNTVKFMLSMALRSGCRGCRRFLKVYVYQISEWSDETVLNLYS
ncbi:hypothetical protein CsSME_00024180 [Camellia sinensis var. sinensis]